MLPRLFIRLLCMFLIISLAAKRFVVLMGARVIVCSLTDIETKVQMLQEQRDILVVQLTLAEEEKSAVAQAAAMATAEAQMHDKLREMLEVCPKIRPSLICDLCHYPP